MDCAGIFLYEGDGPCGNHSKEKAEMQEERLDPKDSPLLYGLIFRGVSFEFRANSVNKIAWNRAFFYGSLTAVVAQGLTLGGILWLKNNGRHFLRRVL